MKIIRHTARDMRQALRAVREQLGDDAVILSSRRTSEGVEVTAAVDFDAATLESGGFASADPGAGQSSPTAASTANANPAGANTDSPPRTQASPAGALKLASPAIVKSTVQPATQTLQRRVAPAEQKIVIPKRALSVVVDDAPDIEHEVEPAPSFPTRSLPSYDTEWISAAAREAVAAHSAGTIAPVLPPAASRTEVPVYRTDEVIEQAQAATLTPFGPTADQQATTARASAATDAMGNELKTLRRMLETQLAHLAWNDRTRRAPIQTEMLRELSEIGIIPDLAEHLVRQLPEDTDLTFARRFTIAGLSQYLRVTGDRWLDDGGRVAFVGATGVGKTTTLAKVAVRWVLRHGPRDIALVAGDSVRIGAQDQLQSLAQLLGVPVYTPDSFENLPSLLSRLSERLLLIDTPGSSVRDAQLSGRLAVLANSASKLETALVLSASTQAGALEETVKHFAPVNPSCCVLTKLDEAASLGGILSILIRARLPVSYVSEGQRVPEDLRPARALELVSMAVRLAKARGAAADEDLLRRRFGRTAHAIT